MNTEKSPQYDISVIKAILPHRDPFLFVDKVTDFETENNIIAEKTLLPNDNYFAGHFPGNPIMPGVLVSEALAQTSGLLLGLTWKQQHHSSGQQQSRLLSLANVNIKFSFPAKPGDTLRLMATLKKHYGRLFLFEVGAYVQKNQIAKGTLALAEEK